MNLRIVKVIGIKMNNGTVYSYPKCKGNITDDSKFLEIHQNDSVIFISKSNIAEILVRKDDVDADDEFVCHVI